MLVQLYWRTVFEISGYPWTQCKYHRRDREFSDEHACGKL